MRTGELRALQRIVGAATGKPDMDARPNRQLLRVGLGAAVAASSPDKVLPHGTPTGRFTHGSCTASRSQTPVQCAPTRIFIRVECQCTQQMFGGQHWVHLRGCPTRNGSWHHRTASRDDGRAWQVWPRQPCRPTLTWIAARAWPRSAPHAADPSGPPLQRPALRRCPTASAS